MVPPTTRIVALVRFANCHHPKNTMLGWHSRFLGYELSRGDDRVVRRENRGAILSLPPRFCDCGSPTDATWAWGVPTSGPNSAHSGSNVWATNLSGNYRANEDEYITSPSIDLSAYASRSVTVSWWEWSFVTPGAFEDVDVSKDGGTTWSTIHSVSPVTANWTRVAVPLPAVPSALSCDGGLHVFRGVHALPIHTGSLPVGSRITG
jgi:hypothetical protein